MNTIFGTQPTNKHKAFISFHHDDEAHRDEFETQFADHFISKAVQIGDIDPDNSTDYTARLIADDYISDASVVIALYGANTHKRKHVDWEISAGLNRKVGGHSGLVVIILPSFLISPYDQNGVYKQELLYPRLHPRTVKSLKSGFAEVYFWKCNYPLNEVNLSDVIHQAYERRVTHKELIDNSDPQYSNNLP